MSFSTTDGCAPHVAWHLAPERHDATPLSLVRGVVPEPIVSACFAVQGRSAVAQVLHAVGCSFAVLVNLPLARACWREANFGSNAVPVRKAPLAEPQAAKAPERG